MLTQCLHIDLVFIARDGYEFGLAKQWCLMKLGALELGVLDLLKAPWTGIDRDAFSLPAAHGPAPV